VFFLDPRWVPRSGPKWGRNGTKRSPNGARKITKTVTIRGTMIIPRQRTITTPTVTSKNFGAA